MTELNDELLVAYVDGQLAKNQSKAVERVLEEDQVAAQRVEALRAANAQLETAFEAMLAGEQIPLPAAGTGISADGVLARSTAARLFLRAGLVTWVGLGCLLGGAAAGFILHEQIAPEPVQVVVAPPPPAPAPEPVIIAPPPATLQDDVAHAHALLSRDTFSLSLDAQGDTDLVGFQISKALGADLAIPDLSSANLTFQRAQMLQREGTPLAQIAYLPETGAPVALYARSGAGEARALKLEDIGGVTLASWGQGELYFLLAGDLPRPRLEALAKTLESQIADAEPKSQDTGMPDANLPQGTAKPADATGAAQTAPPPAAR
ncbi:MAG: anti-sigma factor family protein [Methyloligellaceae bacterium]